MQTNEIWKLAGLFCLLATAGCGGGGDEDDDGPPTPVTTTAYQTAFSSDQLIAANAAPDSTSATASLASASGDDFVASGSVTVNGATATAVTINAGYAGENGPVAVALTDGGGGTWNVPAGTELDSDELSRLQTGGYYVSVRTPGGDLRGQILPPGLASGMVDLDAARVVPASASAGTARAGLTLEPRTGDYRVRVTVTGVADASSAGIRNAIAGARGELVVALEQSTADASVWGTIDVNDPNSGARLTLTGLDLLASGSLYLRLESVSNMDGALRGQIVDDTIRVFDAELTAAEIVTGGAPVDSSAQATATVTWVETLSNFGVAVNTDIPDAVSVAVYDGAPGENGAFVFSLTPDVTLPGNWVLPVTELDAARADALVTGRYYVSVNTAAFPGGELRGQLTLPANP
ncbi:MAG: CHRD domain-containing protein [Pseudomonadota bacterium]